MSEEVKLFQAVEKPRVRRRKRKRFAKLRKKFKSVYMAYALVPIVIIVVFGAVVTADALSKIARSQNDLSNVFSTIENKPATDLTLRDYEQVDSALASLQNALNSAKSRTRLLQVFASVDDDAQARFKLMDAAIHVITGSRNFLAGLKPTVALLERGGTTGISEEDGVQNTSTTMSAEATGERSVELLRAGRNRFLIAEREINAANELLDALELEDVSAEVLLEVEELRDYIAQIETMNAMALEAPDLLTIAMGLDETQTYLILAQNSDELRPSGGYISTWGWMRIRSGRVLDYDYFPTTVNTPDPPPSALGSTLEIPEWWNRHLRYTDEPIYAAWDASWYANFPQTADMAAWYYNNGDNPHTPVDGVIAIDIVAVEYLLGAIGTIYVPEYDRTVSAETFRSVVYEVRADERGAMDHKEFLAAVYKELIHTWGEADAITRSNINRALLQSLREKHIMVYFADDNVHAAAERMGWTGTQTPALEHDYLMISDANLGSKSSTAVRRQITYDVVLHNEGSVDSRLSIFYNFSAAIAEADPAVRPEHYNQRDYYSVLQTFVPAEAELTEASDLTYLTGTTSEIEVVESETHTIYTGLVEVPYDQSTRVQFAYTTPGMVEQFGSYYRYRLLIEKQPGARGDAVTVTVTLPHGMEGVSTTPNADAVYELGPATLEFNLVLTEDHWIEIIYTLDDGKSGSPGAQ